MSGRAWAARQRRPAGADRSADPHPRARRAASRQRRCARRPRHLSARRFPPRRDLARRSRPVLQSGELLLCRRQFQALWRRLFRYRARDFEPVAYHDGATPAGHFPTRSSSLGIASPRSLYNVRGAVGFDPTEPEHSAPYPFDPVPDEPAIGKVRERLKRVGLHPFPLPLGIDIDRWLSRAKTPWDAFPDTGTGKMDAETCGSRQSPCLSQRRATGEFARRAADFGSRRQTGRRRGSFNCRGTQSNIGGDCHPCRGGGELRRSASRLQRKRRRQLLRRSRPTFHELQLLGGAAIDPRTVNDFVYQKTLGINDFYLDDGRGGPPLGNIQLLGRVTGPILKAGIPRAPEWALIL